MATPTKSGGRYYAAAFKQKATDVWDNTPIAVGAGDEPFLSSDGSPELKQEFKPFGGLNMNIPKDGDLGPSDAIDFSPEFSGEGCGLQYEMGANGSLIAALFGTMTAPAAQGGTAAYKHVFDWAAEGADLFTFAAERPNDIIEIPSCVPLKLSLKPGNGFLQGSITMRGNHLNNTSTANTATRLDAVTKAAEGKIIRFQDGVFRMNAEAGDALDSGDDLTLVDFGIDLERVKNARHALGGAHIALPGELKTLVGSLKIKIANDTGAGATWMAAFLAKTAQKATLTFTSAELAAAGYPYSITIGFPRLMLKSAPPRKLEENMDIELEFLILEAAAAPTGMTGHVLPYLEAINLRTSAYVA